jgi:glutamine amidotransferase
VRITPDPEQIRSADHVILPGVGAFGDAMKRLTDPGLDEVIREVVSRGTPFLGICLGLQLLFDSSEESEDVSGLSVFPGEILRIPSEGGLKVPQIGWNSLELKNPSRLLKGIEDGSFVYFVHSYYLKAKDPSIVTSVTRYGTEIHASVEKDNVFATQFHPEKSSETGLHILKNVLEM